MIVSIGATGRWRCVDIQDVVKVEAVRLNGGRGGSCRRAPRSQHADACTPVACCTRKGTIMATNRSRWCSYALWHWMCISNGLSERGAREEDCMSCTVCRQQLLVWLRLVGTVRVQHTHSSRPNSSFMAPAPPTSCMASGVLAAGRAPSAGQVGRISLCHHNVARRVCACVPRALHPDLCALRVKQCALTHHTPCRGCVQHERSKDCMWV